LEGVAEIYSGEIEKRLDRARSTVEKATQGKYARTDKEQSVMDDAATLLEKIAANEQYSRADFEKAKELLRQANKTSGLADNSVVYQLIDFMNTTATAINKNRQQYAKLGREVQRFKNKLSDPTR
jgi:ABC-type transporter Mla subunit MlaD